MGSRIFTLSLEKIPEMGGGFSGSFIKRPILWLCSAEAEADLEFRGPGCHIVQVR